MFVEKIFTSPVGDPTQIERPQISLQRGKGVIGDRNFGLCQYPGQNLTLVEAEEIEAFCREQNRPVDWSLTRRNLVTRGVRLNDLLDREFFIGSIKVRGVELCEPCATLGDLLSSQSLSSPAVVKRWLGRGGLRVDVLSDGEIMRGVTITTSVSSLP